MHTLTGNREQVLNLMSNTIQQLQTDEQASAQVTLAGRSFGR